MACYKLSSCTPNDTTVLWSDLPELEGLVGGTVFLLTYPTTCFTVEKVEAPCACGPLAGFDASVIEGPCECGNVDLCYVITNCSNSTISYEVSTNLNPYVGQTIQIAEYPGCFFVSSKPAIECTDAITVSCVESCICNHCYLLEPCDPALPLLTVSNDLEQYLNQIINVCINGECNCYTVLTSQTCEGAIVIPNPTSTVLSCDECSYCYCPPGYEKVGDICQKIDNFPATVDRTIYTVAAAEINAAYGSLGTNFYPNITSLPYPIYESGSQFIDSALNPLAPVVNINTPGNVWSGFLNSRLNTVGVWTGVAPNPLNEWIGFTHCIDIPETKTYTIGLAGDNNIRFKIDGVNVVEATNGLVFNFNYWHVFEITLTQGFHIIEVQGYNIADAASFGAEIYDSTSVGLQAISTPAALQAVTIFSTFDKINSNFDTGEKSGYVCPPGSSYNNCDNGPTCSIINTAPYIDCTPTYKVVDCENIQPDFITNTDLSAYVNKGPYKVCIPEQLEENINPPQPYAYTLTDCKGIEEPICTVTNLYGYLNTHIALVGYPGSCFLVTANPPGELCPAPVEVTVDGNNPCSCDTPPDPAWAPGCYCVTVLPADNEIAPDFLGVFGDAFASCEACARTCYILTDCKGIENPIKVTGTELENCLDGVIRIKDCEHVCWTVTLADNCNGCIKEVEVIECFPLPKETKICTYDPISTTDTSDVIKITINSTEYTSPPIGYCNPENWINWLNSLNLGTFTYQADSTTPCPIVTFIATGTETYGDLCFVSGFEGLFVCYTSICDVIPSENEPTACEACLAPPVEPEQPLTLKLRAVTPGYTTPGCSPKYYDKVNCNYSDQVYNQMISVRYGLEVCCDEDIHKWEIKKELLDLQSIKNTIIP